MLKITAPFRAKDEVFPLIEAGADELYCGYLPEKWKKRYTDLEFERKGTGSNFTDLKELKTAVKSAHARNIPVYCTLNGLYVQQQHPLLMEIVDELAQVGFDGFIVADLGLLLALRARGCREQIHISTGGTVFNRDAVLFYKELGVSRIILDRQVTLGSMRQLASACPDIEFEVFILNTLCVYIDGFCTFFHCSEMPYKDTGGDTNNPGKPVPYGMVSSYDLCAEGDACGRKYSVRTRRIRDGRVPAQKIEPVFYKRLLDGTACGGCALYDIAKTGVKTLKIVGRQMEAEKRLVGVKFIRQCLDLLRENNGISKNDFILRVQAMYRQTVSPAAACKGNNCYHPEVLIQ